ncbi:MAG TPA: ribonuclease D [Acidiferrobacterales bacterium]
MIATFIASRPELIACCERLRAEPWLAVDTEFMRERTYYARLCLVQIATPDTIACIDPLALDDLEPLLTLLYDPAIVKVLHAARQDLEVLSDLRGAPPAPVFDTQVAAAYLGYDDQIGYAALVESITGRKLDKTHTRTDWAARPLSDEQLRYAEDDVRYLRDVYRELRARLSGQGRLGWVEDDCARLGDPRLYRNPPAEAWRRVKHGHHLGARQQTVLRALAEWREHRAQARDLPRAWILRDAAMLEIARAEPVDRAALGALKELDDKAARRWGEEILEVVARARSGPVETVWDRPTPLSPDQQRLSKQLAAALDAAAREQAIAPAALGTRRELQRLVLGERELPLLKGWRRDLIGGRLLALLAAEPGRAAASP